MSTSESKTGKQIYTRRGDGGETDLLGGVRVTKDDLRVATYGTADELNAALGTCAAFASDEELKSIVLSVQRQLFELGAFLARAKLEQGANAEAFGVCASDVGEIEATIDRLDEQLPPLRAFILPGGTAAAAAFHVARAICRRLERHIVALHRREPLGELPLRYVNRLSDLLFVLARAENARASVADIPWKPGTGTQKFSNE